MTTSPTQQELIARYIADTSALAAQDASAGLPDIAGRCIHLYGAADVAKGLRERFGVDVEGDVRRKQ